jgi:hypothetical protein
MRRSSQRNGSLAAADSFTRRISPNEHGEHQAGQPREGDTAVPGKRSAGTNTKRSRAKKSGPSTVDKERRGDKGNEDEQEGKGIPLDLTMAGDDVAAAAGSRDNEPRDLV